MAATTEQSAAPVVSYVYEPAISSSGEEIPAHTMYRDGEPLAFTD